MPTARSPIKRRFRIALFEYGEAEYACGEWSPDEGEEPFEELYARATAAQRRVIRLFRDAVRQDRKEGTA